MYRDDDNDDKIILFVFILVQKKDLSFDRPKQACYIYSKISVIISQLSNFVNS